MSRLAPRSGDSSPEFTPESARLEATLEDIAHDRHAPDIAAGLFAARDGETAERSPTTNRWLIAALLLLGLSIVPGIAWLRDRDPGTAAAQDPDPTDTESLERIQREHEDALTAWRAEAYTLEVPEGGAWPGIRPPMHAKPFLDRCLALAARTEGEDGDRPLVWILAHATDEQAVVRAAVDRLVARPDARAWAEALPLLPRIAHLLPAGRDVEIIDAVLRATKDDGTRRWAQLLGTMSAAREQARRDDTPAWKWFDRALATELQGQLAGAPSELAKAIQSLALLAQGGPVLDDLDAAILAAWASDRPLLVQFSGWNSPTCRVIETVVPANLRLDGFVTVRLHVDIPRMVSREVCDRHVRRHGDWTASKALPSWVVLEHPSATAGRVFQPTGNTEEWVRQASGFLADPPTRPGR